MWKSDPDSLLVSLLAVIKPIYGAASIGVVRVNSEKDLHHIYARVQREMAAVRVVAGALQAEVPDEVRAQSKPMPSQYLVRQGCG